MGKVTKINILDVPYVVMAQKEVKSDEGQQLAGEIDFYKRVIRIREELPKCCGYEVLAHEIAHGVLEEGGARSAFTQQQREIICDIAGAVARIMINNMKAVEATIEAIGK